jgi:hypothetical protein
VTHPAVKLPAVAAMIEMAQYLRFLSMHAGLMRSKATRHILDKREITKSIESRKHEKVKNTKSRKPRKPTGDNLLFCFPASSIANLFIKES